LSRVLAILAFNARLAAGFAGTDHAQVAGGATQADADYAAPSEGRAG